VTYFSKSRKFVAYLVGVKPKNAKIDTSTAGGHAETRQILELTFDVPLTKPMRTHLSPPVQSWVESNLKVKAGEECLEKASPTKDKPFDLLIKYFEEDSKEAVTLTPNESGGRVKVKCALQRYFILSGEAFAQIRITADFDKALWKWLGDHLAHSNNTVSVETKPPRKVWLERSNDPRCDVGGIAGGRSATCIRLKTVPVG
jgi:hypothetical protein